MPMRRTNTSSWTLSCRRSASRRTCSAAWPKPTSGAPRGTNFSGQRGTIVLRGVVVAELGCGHRETIPPTPTPTPSGGPPFGGCPVFPATNVWNKPVDTLPVRSDSATMISAIGLSSSLHPDFSNVGGYGIPFNVVGSATPRSTVSFLYADESDQVGYPIPVSPKIEGSSDRHILMVDTDACHLYELYDATQSGGAWSAG